MGGMSKSIKIIVNSTKMNWQNENKLCKMCKERRGIANMHLVFECNALQNLKDSNSEMINTNVIENESSSNDYILNKRFIQKIETIQEITENYDDKKKQEINSNVERSDT